MCYYIKHKLSWVDRAVTFVSVTLPEVKSLKAQKLLEENHKDPITVPGIDFKNWPKTMDSIKQWINGHRGIDGSLLGYVTRKGVNLFPEPPATDLSMGDTNRTYMSHDDEVIARHRIINQAAAMRTLVQHEKSGSFVKEFISKQKKV